MKRLLIFLWFLLVAGCSSNNQEMKNIEMAFNIKSYDKVISSLSNKENLTSKESYMLSYSYYKTNKYERAQYVLMKNNDLTIDEKYLLALIKFKRNKLNDSLGLLKELDDELSLNQGDNSIFKARIENLIQIIKCKTINNESCISSFEALSKKYPQSDDIYSNLILAKFLSSPDSDEALSQMYENYEISDNNMETLIVSAIITKNDELALSLLQEKYKDKAKVMRVYEQLSTSLK